MKKDQLIYRISTGLLVVLMLFSAYSYFTSADIKGAFAHLGFPDYFRVQLGVAKAIGAVLLVIPVVPAKVKEFVYAGFGITFISAFIAHMASGDPASVAVPPLVFAVVLTVSYVYFHKLNKRSITNPAL
ncbi:MAG: DoxX family protein [Lacibacter sp.]|nr:DoxX family protein [Lacibacter sp.]